MSSNERKKSLISPDSLPQSGSGRMRGMTGNISNRVSVWVNFSVKNHKENEYFFSSRFARLAVSILSNSHDEFTEERSDPRTQGIQSTQTQGINLCSFLRRTLNFASRGQYIISNSGKRVHLGAKRPSDASRPKEQRIWKSPQNCSARAGVECRSDKHDDTKMDQLFYLYCY